MREKDRWDVWYENSYVFPGIFVFWIAIERAALWLLRLCLRRVKTEG